MSDFNTDLHGKVYALVNGTIDLEDFKSWYCLAVVASAPARTDEPEAKPFVPPPVKLNTFDDYSHIENDPKMAEHHRRMLGSGED